MDFECHSRGDHCYILELFRGDFQAYSTIIWSILGVEEGIGTPWENSYKAPLVLDYQGGIGIGNCWRFEVFCKARVMGILGKYF